jgi:hypothetical protein
MHTWLFLMSYKPQLPRPSGTWRSSHTGRWSCIAGNGFFVLVPDKVKDHDRQSHP